MAGKTKRQSNIIKDIREIFRRLKRLERRTAVTSGSVSHAGITNVHGIDDTRPLVNKLEVTPEMFGAEGDGVTDDTEAFQDAIDFLVAEDAGGVIKCRAATYRFTSAPRTDRSGRCILSLAVEAGSNISIEIEGVNAGQIGQKTIFKCTRTTDTYDADGPASLIGGGTEENGSGIILWCGPVRLKDFRIELEEDSPLAGIDGFTFGGMEVENVNVVYGDGTSAEIVNSNPEAFGFRAPTFWNSGTVRFTHAKCLQGYAALILPTTDHALIHTLVAHKCGVALGLQDPSVSTFPHATGGGYISVSRCPIAISGWDATSGVIHMTTGPAVLLDLNIDIEAGDGFEDPVFNFFATVIDENNIITGSIRVLFLSAIGYSDTGGTFYGAQKLRVILTRTTSAILASSATFTFPPGSDIVRISGSTTIDDITESYSGRTVTIVWHTGATFNVSDSGNIGISSSITDFTEGDSLTLRWSNTHWREVGRSNSSTELRLAALEDEPEACAVTASAAQAIGSGGFGLAVFFDTERRDTYGMHNSSNIDRINILTDGWYNINATVAWAANSTGTRQLSMLDDAGIVLVQDIKNASSAGITSQNINKNVYLTAGQWIRVNVIQSSAGNLNVTKANNNSPEFTVAKLSP